MALPKTVEWVTFDVYGTLIDWESGIWQAFKKEAARDGFPLEEHVNKDKLIDLFHEVSRDVEGGSYEMYAEVLRQTAVRIAKEIEWPLEPSRSGFLPDSVANWRPFRETGPQIRKVLASKTVQSGLIANMDDKLLGITRRHIPGDYDLVVTAQQVRSYKPDPAHFNEFARRVGSKKNWVHITSSYYHDVEPCLKLKVPVIYVNRRKLEPVAGQKKATEEVRTLLDAMKLVGL
jgi:2-haloacid dehalogenase